MDEASEFLDLKTDIELQVGVRLDLINYYPHLLTFFRGLVLTLIDIPTAKPSTVIDVAPTISKAYHVADQQSTADWTWASRQYLTLTNIDRKWYGRSLSNALWSRLPTASRLSWTRILFWWWIMGRLPNSLLHKNCWETNPVASPNCWKVWKLFVNRQWQLRDSIMWFLLSCIKSCFQDLCACDCVPHFKGTRTFVWMINENLVGIIFATCIRLDHLNKYCRSNLGSRWF